MIFMNSHCSLFLFGEILVPRMTMRTLEREIHVCKCLQTYMIIWTVRMERSKNQHWWKEMSPALKMEAQLAAGPSDLQCSDGCFTRKSRFFFLFIDPIPLMFTLCGFTWLNLVPNPSLMRKWHLHILHQGCIVLYCAAVTHMNGT